MNSKGRKWQIYWQDRVFSVRTMAIRNLDSFPSDLSLGIVRGQGENLTQLSDHHNRSQDRKTIDDIKKELDDLRRDAVEVQYGS